MNNYEVSIKDPALTLERVNTVHIPKVFVVCDQRDTAPVWRYILRQQGLTVTRLECRVHPHGNIRALAGDGRDDRAGMSVEAFLAAIDDQE